MHFLVILDAKITQIILDNYERHPSALEDRSSIKRFLQRVEGDIVRIEIVYDPEAWTCKFSVVGREFDGELSDIPVIDGLQSRISLSVPSAITLNVSGKDMQWVDDSDDGDEVGEWQGHTVDFEILRIVETVTSDAGLLV